MENEEKEVFTAEDIKEQAYEEIIKDVIEEIDSREENLKVYYPYFVINKKLQDEKTEIDLNSVFVAILSYLLYTGKLNNRKIEYQDIIDFTEYFIYKIYWSRKVFIIYILAIITRVFSSGSNDTTVAAICLISSMILLVIEVMLADHISKAFDKNTLWTLGLLILFPVFAIILGLKGTLSENIKKKFES